ncbi:glutathione S-transferase family protein [Gammaproteobacteria bacterium AB-CW1]|uniref:Glutathione S-transferase family protein n=1 Tax=Natronospira elongata TaxID=3110268 RepID=A0AAP6JEP4_9GAMM|nr:glutathione S-transferase family protein [Gammaproteobacteria bacterium AB-CW1]
MGLLVEGKWVDQWYDTEKHGGRFVRESAQFRNWITADGSAGPNGEGGFEAEPGRYHIYFSYACPWAHRTLIFRKLKRLEEVISVSPVDPDMLENGWEFGDQADGTADPLFGSNFLHQVYTRADAHYTGRVTVPVIWDRKRETIVSNESADIIRMLNSEFQAFTDVDTDYYPKELREDIDSINEMVYHQVNNGVYRCGFATSQAAYEEAFEALFQALDELEQRLSRQRYLVGDTLTEADWRLFTTLLRFDPVYVGHFKTNLRRIADYPNLLNYTRELYQVPGVAETVNLRHIKRHYYYSHGNINPTRIVPRGPVLNLDDPHDRDRFSN